MCETNHRHVWNVKHPGDSKCIWMSESPWSQNDCCSLSHLYTSVRPQSGISCLVGIFRVWNSLETHYNCWWLILHSGACINYLSNKRFLYFMTLPWMYKKKNTAWRLCCSWPDLTDSCTKTQLYSVMNWVRSYWKKNNCWFSPVHPGLLGLEQL